MAFRSSIEMFRNNKAGAWLTVPLFLPCMLVDGIRLIGIAIKRILIERWSRQIMDQISSENRTERFGGDCHGCKNLAGLGGQSFRMRWTTWDELFLDSNCLELRRWGHRSNVVRDHMFFAYFGPLEAWCDTNLHSGYYLWSDDGRINLVLTNPTDEVLWRMTWGNGMPALSEVEDLARSS